MINKKSKILITGGSGLIGQNLTNRLFLTHEGYLETFKDSKEINGKKYCGILKVELPGSIDNVPSKREFIIK